MNGYISYKEKLANHSNILYTKDNYHYKNVNGVIIKEEVKEYKCLLTDNNGDISSDYNFNYERLSNLLLTGFYSNFIQNGDYIKLITKSGHEFKLYLNIDTYFNKGIEFHHIDFISEELIPESVGWMMRKEITYNGDENDSPYISSNIHYLLKEYYYSNIPDKLKKHIVDKECDTPINCNEKKTEFKSIGKLWIPYEKEIYGKNRRADEEKENNLIQYPVFMDTNNNIKYDKNYSNIFPSDWWTASVNKESNSYFCGVMGNGCGQKVFPTNKKLGVPLCFRFK